MLCKDVTKGKNFLLTQILIKLDTAIYLWYLIWIQILWKESLNNDGQQFHQYQQNKQLRPTNLLNIKKRGKMTYDFGNPGPGLEQAQNISKLWQIIIHLYVIFILWNVIYYLFQSPSVYSQNRKAAFVHTLHR
jgi:hypothetical protein